MSYLLKLEGGLSVITQPPDTTADTEGKLNIFLYQVSANSGYRNMDLPARNYSGDLVKKQQLGLDLHYLLTAYGKTNEELSSQKILAEAMRVLHENPVLTRDLIQQAIGDPDFGDISSSDLAEQPELVKVTLENLSLEDLTKMWSSFFKMGSYRISVAYKATVVLLDGKKQPKSTMPVRKINSYVYASRAPEITYVEPQIVRLAPGGTKIKIVGRNLDADTVKIDFGDGLEIEHMPEPDPAFAAELTVSIPNTFGAGIRHVRVLHPLLIGTPETLHRGLESNTALFSIVPIITSVSLTSSASGSKLTIKIEPSITPDQDVKVIINNYKPLNVEWSTTGPTTDTVQVTIPVDYAKNKDMPVRLIVDSAESQPDEENWPNEFKRPLVNII